MKTRTPLQILSYPEYLKLRENATVIEADQHGDKVLRLPDGSYLKFFRRKRLLSSALLYPYAVRFADNLDALHQRGIPCPTQIAAYRIAAISRDAIHYAPLEGKTLRQVLKEAKGNPDMAQLRSALGEFVADLHQAGIYFRSLHLGNIVLTSTGQLGLIDVSDLVPHHRPLGRMQRARNMKHMLRYPAETAWLGLDDAFQTAYDRRSLGR